MDEYTNPSPTLWACTDCYMLHCNGELPPEMSVAEQTEFLGRVNAATDNALMTAGMLADEHGCAYNCVITDKSGQTYRYKVTSLEDAINQSMLEWEEIRNIEVVMLRIANDDGNECYCEHNDFTWRPCDICGSNLGGSRDAVTLWYKADVAA